MADLYSIDIVGLSDAQGKLVELGAMLKAELWMAASDLEGQCTKVYREWAPKKTGAFAASIVGSTVRTDDGFVVTVGTPDEPLETWLREGTGLYGPLRHRIYPSHKGKLRRDALGRFIGGGVGGRSVAFMGPIFDWIPKFPSAATFASSSMTGLKWFQPKGGGAGPFYFASIAGMRPNPWEVAAGAECVGLADAEGNKIARDLDLVIA